MDEKALEYLRWEAELCTLLKHHGWVKSVESNRQDTFVTWTAKGQKCCERFVDEVCALPRDREWTDAELVRLRGFAQYQGILKSKVEGAFPHDAANSSDDSEDRETGAPSGWRKWFSRRG